MPAAWKPLMDACFAGDDKKVAALLREGADPNLLAGGGWNWRPLHRTVYFRVNAPKHDGHARVVRLLLEAGSDPSLRASNLNMTPLLLASIAGEAGCVEELAAYTKRWDVFAAATVGDLTRLKRILKKDPALASVRDEAGVPALWYVSASRYLTGELSVEAARVLLDAGASASSACAHVPCLHMALGHARNEPLARFLVERGADLSEGHSLVHSSCHFHFEHLEWGLRWMLKRGADPNAAGEDGMTPLHKAAFLGYVRCLRVLVDAGGDHRRRDRRGLLPVDWARQSRKTITVEFLEGLG